MATIEVRLKPGSKLNRIELSPEGLFDIKITSRPIEGKANEHLIKFLAKEMKVPKSSIAITVGSHSRTKVVSIDGLERSEITERLGL